MITIIVLTTHATSFAQEEFHPLLRAYDLQQEATLAEAKASSEQWMPPMFGYSVMLDPLFGHAPGHMVMLSQTLPAPGARHARAHVMRATADQLQWERRATEDQLRWDVMALSVEHARILKLADTLEQQHEVLGRSISVIEHGMAHGHGEYSDFMRLNLMLELIAERLDTLKSQADVARIRIQERLAPHSIGAQLLLYDLSARKPLPTRDALIEKVRSHPQVQAQNARQSASLARAEAISSARLLSPTLSLGFESRPMGGERLNMITAGVSLPLPFVRPTWQQEQRAELFRAQAAAAQTQARMLAMEADVDAALRRISEAQERLRRYEVELLPLSRDVATRLLSELELGRTDASRYLLAVQQQLELEERVIELEAMLALEYERVMRWTRGGQNAN